MQVPRGEPQVVVEHRDAVGHVVEGDAQLGLALADFVQQPRILHRDHRLRREVFATARSACRRTAGPRGGAAAIMPSSTSVLAQRHAQHGADAVELDDATRNGSSDLDALDPGSCKDALAVEQTAGSPVAGRSGTKPGRSRFSECARHSRATATAWKHSPS